MLNNRCLVYTRDAAQFAYGAVLDKLVGQAQPYNLGRIVMVGHPFGDSRSQTTASHTVFYGDDAAEPLAHLVEYAAVDGFEIAHIVMGHSELALTSTSATASAATLPIGPMVSTATS